MERLKFKKLDYSVKNAEGVEEIKKSEGVLPTRATAGDAGLDLYATRMTQDVDNSGKLVLVYHTDIAVEIPEGYVGLLCMKSSVANRSITLVNSVGIIDSGYRGELMAKFKVTTDSVPTIYSVGEAFAQLLVVPCGILEPVFVEELSETDRGTKGFGEADKVEIK
jgi:dUTP pyrophosphatase